MGITMRRIKRRQKVNWFDIIENLNRKQTFYFVEILTISQCKKDWFIFKPIEHRNTTRRYLQQLKKLGLIQRQTNGHGNKKSLRLNPRFISFLNEEGIEQKLFKRNSQNTKKVHTSQKSRLPLIIYNILYIYTIINNSNYQIVKVSNNNIVARRKKVKNALKNNKPKTRTLKRRIDPDIQEVIDHWNTFEFPFAKVVKSNSLIKPIKQAFAQRTVPRKHQVDELKNLISKAHKYMTLPIFKFNFTSKNKLRMLNFFVAEPRNMMGKFLLQNGFTSWHKLFQRQGETWIEYNLLKMPKLRAQQEDDNVETVLEDMRNIFSWFDSDDFETKSTMITLANKAMKMAKEHNLGYGTIIYHLKEYIKYEDVSKQELHWYASDRFWNYTLRNHIKHVRGI